MVHTKVVTPVVQSAFPDGWADLLVASLSRVMNGRRR